MKYGTKKIKTETVNATNETVELTADVPVIEEATFDELVALFGAEKVGKLALSQDTTNRMNEARLDLREGGKRAAAKAALEAKVAEITRKLTDGEVTPAEAAKLFAEAYAAK